MTDRDQKNNGELVGEATTYKAWLKLINQVDRGSFLGYTDQSGHPLHFEEVERFFGIRPTYDDLD